MKSLIKTLLAVVVYLLMLLISVGCENESFLEENGIDPIGVWGGSKKDSNQKLIVINYTLESETYTMIRSVSDITEYRESGTWAISSDNVFTFTPVECMALDSLGSMVEVSTEIEYTGVYFEEAFSYYYWDDNSEFMILNIEKQ